MFGSTRTISEDDKPTKIIDLRHKMKSIMESNCTLRQADKSTESFSKMSSSLSKTIPTVSGEDPPALDKTRIGP